MRSQARALGSALLTSLALLALPRPAYAQSAQPAAAAPQPGGDVIHLKDGGMLRGTLIEAIPNDHATIQLATGSSAIVAWEKIARIERSSPAVAAAAAVPTAAVVTQGVFVHIESDRTVTLERMGSSRRIWTAVCNSPCDRELDPNGTYRIAGRGVRASGNFSLSARPGERVVIEVDPASKAAFVGGIVLTSVSIPVMLISALVGLVLSAADSAGIDTNPTPAWIVAGASAGALIGGIVMIANNSSSTAAVQPLAARPAASDPRRREATWRTAGTFDPASPPTVPLLRVAF
jgi:hypothetical protein